MTSSGLSTDAVVLGILPDAVDGTVDEPATEEPDCLYGHSAFQWPFLLQLRQYEFRIRSCRLRFGLWPHEFLPFPAPLANEPLPLEVEKLDLLVLQKPLFLNFSVRRLLASV